MKKFIEAWKIFQLVRSNANILMVVTDIFKFVQTTSHQGRPMTCKIALLNTGDGSKVGDYVSLWAGIGESNPIDRSMQLRRQRDELERQLKFLLGKYPVSDQDRKDIEFTLKCFNL